MPENRCDVHNTPPLHLPSINSTPDRRLFKHHLRRRSKHKESPFEVDIHNPVPVLSQSTNGSSIVLETDSSAIDGVIDTTEFLNGGSDGFVNGGFVGHVDGQRDYFDVLRGAATSDVLDGLEAGFGGGEVEQGEAGAAFGGEGEGDRAAYPGGGAGDECWGKSVGAERREELMRHQAGRRVSL